MDSRFRGNDGKRVTSHRSSFPRLPARLRQSVLVVAPVPTVSRATYRAVLAAVRTVALLLLLAGTSNAAAEDGGPPLVAAAASLRHVFAALTEAWEETGGARPEVSFGSSGNLYRKIVQGAPFELFLSADEGLALALGRAGRTEGEGVVYGVGRLALLVPRHSRLALDASLADLGRAIDDGRLRRLAVANPTHAPYGRAAREALSRAALWPRLDGRLLLAENAAQAAQFTLSRGADGGLIPHALALDERIASRARHVVIDASMHAPIVQRMVLLSPARPRARALFGFLAGPSARRIFRRFGFEEPEGEAQ